MKVLTVLIASLFLLGLSSRSLASPYMEAGTSLGKMTGGNAFFQTTGAESTSLGFMGSLSLYFPITSRKNFFHLDLGIQNRMAFLSSENGQSLTTSNPHLSLRLELWRLFVGGGYAPFTYSSTDGLMALKSNNGSSAYFGEAGLIWRVIPEFQIALAAGIEFGSPASGGTSPNPSTEFGLRFRFPLSPSDHASDGAVDFDGFRYPFGFMRD